jgi:hypothetical protein
MRLVAALVLAATSATLADTAKPALPFPQALAEHLGAAPTDCPPGLEAYGRPANTLCFTVALKEKPLKKAVNRFLKKFDPEESIQLPWHKEGDYRLRRVFNGTLYNILLAPEGHQLVVLRPRSCFASPRLEGVIEIEPDTPGLKPPLLTNHVSPDHPSQALSVMKYGVALFQMIIGPTGQVEDVCLVEVNPKGYGFEKAGADAVRRRTYEPTKRDGLPVAVLGTISVKWWFGPGRRPPLGW